MVQKADISQQLSCIHLYQYYIYTQYSKRVLKRACILGYLCSVLSCSKNWLYLVLSFVRCHCREQQVKCIGYTKQCRQTQVAPTGSKHKAMWRGWLQQESHPLTHVLLIHSVSVWVGIGADVRNGVWKGGQRQG